MKKIEAIIKPLKLYEVKNALDEVGIEEMTVTEVKAFGRQKAHTDVHQGTKFSVGALPEIKIELVLTDSQMSAAISAIIKGTKTTKEGNGKVFVPHIDDVV